MKLRTLKYLLTVFGLFIALGFTLDVQDVITSVINKLTKYYTHRYQEKLYVQTSADVYFAGDILWFSTRLLDAQNHSTTSHSKVIHIKLFDANNKEFYHKKVLSNAGVGAADIHLSDSLKTGVYHLIGYTEWMKNFNQEYLFHKQLYVINEKPDVSEISNTKNEINAVNFFPEGGNFLEGASTKMGIKITDNSGKGIQGEGYILNDRNDTISKVATYKFGMGSFYIKPKKGRSYNFYIKDEEKLKKYALPRASEEGVSFSVKTDTLKNVNVLLRITKKIRATTKKIALVVLNRGQLIYAAEGQAARQNVLTIPRSKLSSGVNQITIFNESGQPLAERLLFIQPNFSSGLKLTNLKSTYASRERVKIGMLSNLDEPLQITISIQDQKPLLSTNISNYLLLTSDLQGDLGDVSYYLNDFDSARVAAENLMLTQTWSRTNWDAVLSTSEAEPIGYLAESNGLSFRGKLINKNTGDAVTDTILTLSILNKYPNILFKTLTNKHEFSFDLHDMYGKQKMFVNVLNQEHFKDYELIPFNKFDTFKIRLPKVDLDISDLSVEEQIKFRKTEKQIVDNYRFYNPKLYTIPIAHQSDDIFFGDQYLDDPNHLIIPENFQSMENLREMFFELVPSAKLKKKKVKEKLYVYNEELPSALQRADAPHYFYTQPATFFVDGVPIYDDNYVFNLPYESIYKVEIYNASTFIYNKYAFNGIVAITTRSFHKGESTDLEDLGEFYTFDGFSVNRDYNAINDYSNGTNKIPDLRHVLKWEPNKTIPAGRVDTLSFETSDVQHDFYIKIEGVSKSGQPLYAIRKFTVTE